MIDRQKLLERHNPHLVSVQTETPLSVGNGEFAFTADITGLQTFYEEQKKAHVPLCTMSQWGWHTAPGGDNRNEYYTSSQVVKTTYDNCGRTVSYASKCQPGNEEIYHWLRQNPHRLNLGRIGFLWNGEPIHPQDITKSEQTLTLYDGILKSSFTIGGYLVETETICARESDVLGVMVRSEALGKGLLTVQISFPYGSSDITASDWEHEDWHQTIIESGDYEAQKGSSLLHRILDKDNYYIRLNRESISLLTAESSHCLNLKNQDDTLTFTIGFFEEKLHKSMNYIEVKKSSINGWRSFWNTCGMIELHNSKDERAVELERRIVLSQYLLNLQSCGSRPPQETGLTCNSWYGKFHLEMYPWHCAWAPLWNQSNLLTKSLGWYKKHLENARDNARSNGYKGARWPKMVADDAKDSPSFIATLLIWQQPHIIYMLELVYQNSGKSELLQEYWEVVKDTADFMCDFAVYNEKTGKYDLPSPLIPAQEEHDPRTTKNPVFELEYWHFTLMIAVQWAKRLGKEETNWQLFAEKMAPSYDANGMYMACETCPSTFEEFNRDHPSMTGAFGLIPGERLDPHKMEATLKKVFECWEFTSMWGWDFAMMAMTAVRIHDPQTAIEILLKDTPKNSYVTSGNNYQKMRNDLPLYLPGNGSLLLAAAMMTAGYEGCEEKLPGFPKNGMWEVEYENIHPFPY